MPDSPIRLQFRAEIDTDVIEKYVRQKANKAAVALGRQIQQIAKSSILPKRTVTTKRGAVVIIPSEPGRPPRERTGRLKASIGIAFAPERGAVLVGPNTPYAALLEFGTAKMAARPYMRPALAIAMEPSRVRAAWSEAG